MTNGNKKKRDKGVLAAVVVVGGAAAALWYLNQKKTPPCSQNSDCPTGHVCVNGSCQPTSTGAPTGTISITVQSSRLGSYATTSGPTIYPTPSDVVAHLTVTGGFPAPDASVLFEVAGPDLNNQTPTNYVAQTPQTKSAVPLNTPQTFSISLSQVGFYSIRVTVTLSNSLGQATLGPQIISLGIGTPPSGTIS